MLYLLSAASHSSGAFVTSLCTMLCLFLVSIRETNIASKASAEESVSKMVEERTFQSINNRITTSKLLKLFDFAAHRHKLVSSNATRIRSQKQSKFVSAKMKNDSTSLVFH